MAKDPELLAHLEWLGFLQPVGLVVSPFALLNAQAHVDRNVFDLQQRLLKHVQKVQMAGAADPIPAILDLPRLFREVFGWRPTDLIAGPDLPPSLEVVLTDYHDALRPTFAVPEARPGDDGAAGWIMLLQTLPTGADLDRAPAAEGAGWHASPEARFERLLRETRVPIGLLVNGTSLRLVYAPRGESSGHLTFPVRAMTETAGRPILAALHMLLSAERLFSLPEKQRLPAILAESRRFQNTVSTRLAGQVLEALYELLRGFQAADEQRHGDLLRDVLNRDPDQVYAGLLAVLLRLVFLLYAEDRGLTPSGGVFVNHYSVAGLFDQLRADAGRHPDTMDQRYGAWARLLTLFRLVYDGGAHPALSLPARKGHLFDPDRYAFLEGRLDQSRRAPDQRLDPPLVPDGVLYRVLEKLLILDGERLAYSALEVEHIGSVYETMMGFRLEKAAGRSIAVRPAKAHGAPASINLDELLTVAAGKRNEWLKERTDQALTGAALNALKEAKTPNDVVAALGRKVAAEATPRIVPPGAMVLQPSDERRRSGSHYTPRSLTEPIVRKALEPVLKQLGERPTPEQILALKVCDKAMGSGAFLFEACRQLAETLVAAWRAHKRLPTIPPDEDELLHARRLVAQRCLYGVDKNPIAVDLAKLSLWLATLAKDHPFTFLDHALRCGDSLVGLTRKQITDFHWKDTPQLAYDQKVIVERVHAATRYRQEILEGGDFVSPLLKSDKLALADESLGLVRFTGNLVVAAFFAEDNDKKRQAKRETLLGLLAGYLQGNIALRPTTAEQELRAGPKGITPFHWEIEFPEVFGRENPGFDCIVGNPPFAGKNTIIAGSADGYLDWLKVVHAESHGNADLVAHFFRRAFTLVRGEGTFGLIATNTIAQGDTRGTGLRWICTHGGTIYAARRRTKWPGQAAVVVSVVHIAKASGGHQPPDSPYQLDGRPVPLITAYLFHAGGHENPATLQANANKSFQGSIVLGMGFTFDDTDKDGVASPLAEMRRMIEKDKRNAERIFPYIGGEEVNNSPTHAHHRYVINFGDMTEAEARRLPDLMSIVEGKVKPVRLRDNRESYRRYWWQFAEKRADLAAAIHNLERVLVCLRVSETLAFTFLSAKTVFANTLYVFSFGDHAGFSILQSRTHETWARFFSATLKDDQAYHPSDCFETFPFPDGFETHPQLEAAGQAYYEFRAALMVRNNEGLTKTYNRFHDPDETSADIQQLRELHWEMDRAVLEAYRWDDLWPRCEFLLDYEEEDDEESGGSRRRKKPWRYRWPDESRDEVLARLLELNKRRAEQEALAGAAATITGKRKGKGKRSETEKGPKLL